MSCHTECSEKSYLLSEPKTDNLKTTIQVLTFCCTNGFEAQSIAIALDKEIQPPRPLTHDLFKSLAINYKIKIKQVIIHKLIDGLEQH